MTDKNYIIIDKKAAQTILHHINHMDTLRWVPDAIKYIKFENKMGKEVCLNDLFILNKKKMEAIGNYLKIALENQDE